TSRSALLCLVRESDSWHSPGRRREFCHHALECRCTVRSHRCARSCRRTCSIVRDVLATDLQLCPSARLRSSRCTGSDAKLLFLFFANQGLRAHGSAAGQIPVVSACVSETFSRKRLGSHPSHPARRQL